MAVRGRSALMLRTGMVVVRLTMRVSPSSSSIASVVSETLMVTVWCWWTRPRATFWPQTMTTPVFEARRWTRIGSCDGRGGGPALRIPRSCWICWLVSGLGLVRSSSLVSRSKNITRLGSSRTPSWRPARISAASTT